MNHWLFLTLLSCVIMMSATSLWSTKGSSKRQSPVIKSILEIVSSPSKNGGNDVNKQELIRLVNELPKISVKRESMYGKWNLLYTTEKETNFITKYFGKCTEVYQQINENSINNVIAFEDKVFSVDGVLLPNNDGNANRVYFKFTQASLTFTNQKPFNFPPFGSGYFDNLYIDDQIRISFDIRGDYLISERVKIKTAIIVK